ncbi:MAG: DUF4197 domain-containing protein [Myxococcota bacterium]
MKLTWPGLQRRIPALTLTLLLLACAASAQDDWFKRGRDLLGGGTGASDGTASLTESEMSGGLREALRVGTERVVEQVGRPGGFSADPAIRIPLPGSLENARKWMANVGMLGMLDDLERKRNEAAEDAAPKARDLFVDAITEMTVDDARNILTGPDDAATRYFQGKMSAPLAKEMTPVVKASLSEVGAVRQYDAVLARYQAIPFAPEVSADLTAYVVEKGMDGIFHYLAIQEAEIRNDPAARTTALLQKVFGGS